MEETIILECPKCANSVIIIVDPAMGKYEQAGAFNTIQKSDHPWTCPYCEMNGVFEVH